MRPFFCLLLSLPFSCWLQRSWWVELALRKPRLSITRPTEVCPNQPRKYKIRCNNCAYNYDYNTLVVWELNGWSSVMSLTVSVTTAFPSLLKRMSLSMNILVLHWKWKPSQCFLPKMSHFIKCTQIIDAKDYLISNLEHLLEEKHFFCLVKQPLIIVEGHRSLHQSRPK